jgi:endonuclease YncB( thermonuclease family)
VTRAVRRSARRVVRAAVLAGAAAAAAAVLLEAAGPPVAGVPEASSAGRPSVPVGETLAGAVRVVDGDTVDLVPAAADAARLGLARDAAVRIRLDAIDAPEPGQPCLRDADRADCGRAASEALRAIAADGLACRVVDLDTRWNRLVGVCLDAAGNDVAALLVARGLALADLPHDDAHAALERRACVAGAGIWGWSFQPPAEHRRREPWDGGRLACR